MTVKAITFDFWRTLFRDRLSEERNRMRIEALAQRTGLSYEKADHALRRIPHVFMQVHIEEQRTLGPRDAVDMAYVELGLTFDESISAHLTEVFGTAILKYPPEPIEGALEAVERAAALVPVGVISDSGMSPGSSLQVLLDRHGFTPHFTHITFSDQVGVAKPHMRMFEVTAEALKVAPSELFHIGDLEPTDIAGVQALGGSAGLFAGDNDRFKDDTAAQFTFTAWSEFIEALPQVLSNGNLGEDHASA